MSVTRNNNDNLVREEDRGPVFASPFSTDLDVESGNSTRAGMAFRRRGQLQEMMMGYDALQVAASGIGERSQRDYDTDEYFGGIGVSRTTSGSTNPGHPNVFVRGLPLVWSEQDVMEIFQKYGKLTSLRLVRHNATRQSLGYGFVRYEDPGCAEEAILRLNGAMIMGQTLQVKFADSDAGPPSSTNSSGQTPCDTCYVKHIPSTFRSDNVKTLFASYGSVLDVKMFPVLDQFRGASALVRLTSTELASRAAKELNGIKMEGYMHALIVRFAESSAEKVARLGRKEKQNGVGASTLPLEMLSLLPSLPANMQSRDIQERTVPRGRMGDSRDWSGHAMADHQSTGPMHPVHHPVHHPAPQEQHFASQGQGKSANMGQLANVLSYLASAPAMDTSSLGNIGDMNLSSGLAPQPQSQSASLVADQARCLVEVRNLPPGADRLLLYETFSHFGAILFVSMDTERQTGIVLYASRASAAAALQALHEISSRVGRVLHLEMRDVQI
eukprot:jgi/Picsp_1/1259/NSC_04740-R1_elav-like protein 2 isoform 2